MILTVISMSLVCDGTSDTCLQEIVQWIMDTSFPEQSFRILPAKEVIPAHEPLPVRLRRAYQLYSPNLIICHRDAEGIPLQQRIAEIDQAASAANLPVPTVPTVPVRMLESWLLIDEQAIRSAANNRNGTMNIGLPSSHLLENLQNPKQVLFSALRTACGLSPHRLRRFNEHQARSRVTSFVGSFDKLRLQSGFQLFEQRFVATVGALPVGS